MTKVSSKYADKNYVSGEGMRTIVLYKHKRKTKWVYMSFATKKMIREFLKRTEKLKMEVTIKTIRS